MLFRSELDMVEVNRGFDDFCWNLSGINKDPQEIIVRFYFDEKKEAFILNRLTREGHNGIISRPEAGVYEYRISLRDPKEIIPWVRSFGERAQVISSGDFEIEKTIKADWEKAVNKYESLSRI